jgi:hypothetical protein
VHYFVGSVHFHGPKIEQLTMDVRRRTTTSLSSSIASSPVYGGTVKKNGAIPSPTQHVKESKTVTAKTTSSLYDTDKLKRTSNNKATTAADAKATDDRQLNDEKNDMVWLKSLLVKDPSLSASSSSIQQAAEIWRQIQAVHVLPRRLSVSDNDLIHKLVQVTNNDPSVTELIMMSEIRACSTSNRPCCWRWPQQCAATRMCKRSS